MSDFKALMGFAHSCLSCGEHTQALSYLYEALPLASKGRQWSMTMTAIRFTLKAGNIINV